MASSITFAGATLWADNSTGVGRPRARIVAPGYRKIMVFVPAYGTYIEKNLGAEPGQVIIECRYWVTGEQRESLESTIEGANDDVGVLALVLNSGSASYNRCTLFSPGEIIRTDRQVKFPGGSTLEEVAGIFQFQRLR